MGIEMSAIVVRLMLIPCPPQVEAGNKSVEVLDLSRLMPSLIPEPVWKTYRFSIQNQVKVTVSKKY